MNSDHKAMNQRLSGVKGRLTTSATELGRNECGSRGRCNAAVQLHTRGLLLSRARFASLRLFGWKNIKRKC